MWPGGTGLDTHRRLPGGAALARRPPGAGAGTVSGPRRPALGNLPAEPAPVVDGAGIHRVDGGAVKRYGSIYLAYPAHRGNAALHAVQTAVAARPHDHAAATVIGVGAEFPAAVVDDDGNGAVIEAVAAQVARFALQAHGPAAHANVGEQQHGAPHVIGRLRPGWWWRRWSMAAVTRPVHFTDRRNGVIHAGQAAVIALAQHAATAPVVGVLADFPGTRTHDDARRLVIKAHARQVAHVGAHGDGTATEIAILEQGHLARIGGQRHQRGQQGGGA